MDDKDISSLISKLNNDFSIHKIEFPSTFSDVNKLQEIREFLKLKIAQLMERNFEKFLNTLYRIDISEEKVEQIFTTEEKELIPSLLADLIIERQLQRIKTQSMYKNGEL